MQWAGMLLMLPLGYIAWRSVAFHPRADMALSWLLWGLLSLLSLWAILQGPDTFSAKPQGPFNDPNTFAATINMMLLPVLARYLAEVLPEVRSWRRTAQLALIGLGSFALFLIASRGAMLSLALVMLPLLWVARDNATYGRKLALLAIVGCIAYLAALWVTEGSGNVLMRMVGTLQRGDSSRIALMLSALSMIGEHPWLGSGLGSFRLLYPRFRLEDDGGTGGGWVHNDYLQLWQEAGLPMLVLVLALLCWVGREMWRSGYGPRPNREALIRFGYLSGMMVIFIQAATNFVFYFAFVSLFLGLYLGRLRQAPSFAAATPAIPRAWRMAVVAYGSILLYLFAGHAMVESLLSRKSLATQLVTRLIPSTSRYELAFWLSVASPFHHSPPQVMGQELAGMLDMFPPDDVNRLGMLAEALSHMDDSQRLVPCYLPYGSEALAMLVKHGDGPAAISRGYRQVERNLACNSRHGLTHYYSGLLHEQAGDEAAALRVWRQGIHNAFFFADKLMLATVILARTTPEHKDKLNALAARMAEVALRMEANPNIRLDSQFWIEAQHQLLAANQSEFLKLIAVKSAAHPGTH
jgi:O-antigen ligase